MANTKSAPKSIIYKISSSNFHHNHQHFQLLKPSFCFGIYGCFLCNTWKQADVCNLEEIYLVKVSPEERGDRKYFFFNIYR